MATPPARVTSIRPYLLVAALVGLGFLVPVPVSGEAPAALGPISVAVALAGVAGTAWVLRQISRQRADPDHHLGRRARSEGGPPPVRPTDRSLAARLLASVLAITVGVTGFLVPAPAGADLPTSSTPDTVAAGAYIVDMGVSSDPETDLLMYGMIEELVSEHQVPVTWAIRNGKAKDGTVDQVDFSVGGKDYRGGAFIIRPEYASEALATISAYRSMGLTIDGPVATEFDVPEFATLTYWPKAVLDADNGSIARGYYQLANVAPSSYEFKAPSALDGCDDLYVMPHADPTWSTHSNLVTFNELGGYIWAACHAVSVLENVDSPTDPDPAPNMNFLSVNGLVDYRVHDDADGPYDYRTSLGSDPVFQFVGRIDSATESGSEQVYLPRTGGWRPSTKVLVWDGDHPDVPSRSPGEAAKLVYGRGFGDPTNGLVMYEGGHTHLKGDGPDVVAALRAFFNLHLLAGIERRPDIVANVPTSIGAGETVSVDATVTGGQPGYDYEWTSTCGGTFADPSGTTAATSPATVATTFTAPATDADCVVRLVVIDTCGRENFAASSTEVREPADLSITKVDDVDPAESGGTLTYTLSVANAGPADATGVTVDDALPPEVSLVSATPDQGSCGLVGGSVACELGDVGNGAVVDISVVVAIDRDVSGELVNTATVAGDQPDPDPSDNTATETTGVSSNGLRLAKSAAPALVNLVDDPGGTTVTWTFEVTNTAPSELADPAVTDDTCAPVDPVESAGRNVGDADADGLLDQGETWEFSCAQVVGADTTNTATATATDAVLGPITSPPTSAAVDAFTPAVAVDKGPDPLVLAPESGNAIFTIVVQNTGDADLGDVTVSDPAAPDCDRVFAALAVGEVITYQCEMDVTGLSVGDTGSNEATVTAAPPIGADVTATDTVGWEVVEAILDVDKVVTSPSPAALYPGDPVSYRVDVTNTGSATQTNVTLGDALPNTVGPHTVTVEVTDLVVDDDFEADAGSTTSPYARGWIEDGESTNKTGNDIRVRRDSDDQSNPCPGDCVLHLQKDPAIYQAVDLTGSSSITVAYDLRYEDIDGNPDKQVEPLNVVVWDGTDYVVVDSIPIGSMSPSFVAESVTFDPSAVGADIAAGRVGFQVALPSGANKIHIDNVVITSTRSFTGGTPPALVTAADGIDLLPGGTMTVTVDAVVDPAIPIATRTVTNTATATSDQQGPVSDVASVTVVNPGVALVKSVDRTQVAPGDEVTYTIEVSNTGNDPLVPTVADPDCPPLLDTGDTDGDGRLDTNETWIYVCSTATPVATNTATVTTVDSLGNPGPTAADSASVEVVDSDIAVVKSADRTIVRPGDDVTYTYLVTTNGVDESLTAVSLVDDACGPVQPVLDAGFNVGDADDDGSLDLGETWEFTCTAALASTTTNTATARGTDRIGERPTATATETVTVVDPAIGLEKTRLSPADPVVAGATVTYGFSVTNEGNDPIADVAVTDNLCSPVTYDSGDDGDDVLGVGESWLFTCAQVLDDDTTNIAEVTGTDSLGGAVEASDELTVDVDVASLTLGKLADPIVQYLSPTNPLADTVTYSYKVQNSGETDFVDFGSAPTTTITDDACSPLVRGVDLLGDGDDDLESGESWSYTCETLITELDTVNVFSVTATDDDGTVVVADPVSFRVTGIDPSMSLGKSASATTVRPGDAVTYTYEVRNTSPGTSTTHFLDDPEVADDACAPVTYVSGDDGDLHLGFVDDGAGGLESEVWVFTCTTTLTEDTTNTATLTASDAVGNAVPEQTAQATVDVIRPAVEMVLTAGDAADGETEYVASGDTVTYSYVVTNTGDDPLTGVAVSDSEACTPVVRGPDDPGDDDAVLDVGESWTYTCDATIAADVTNTATVTADDSLGGEVTDTDPATIDVVAPGVTIVKSVYAGHDAGASCPGSTSLEAAMDTAVTYCFAVTNVGDTHLDDVRLDDTVLGVDDTAMTLLAGTFPLAPSGGTAVFSLETTFDTVTDGDTFVNDVDVSANPTDAAGDDLPGVADVADVSSATVDATAPSFTVAKTVYLGHDGGASCAGVESVRGGAGAAVTYCFTLTNTGGTYLTDPVVVDGDLGVTGTGDLTAAGTIDLPLAPGASATWYAEATVPADDLTNTVSADATPSDAAGTPTGDDPAAVTDTASVDVPSPAVTVDKSLYIGHDAGGSCPGAASLTGPTGLEVTYCFVVTNTGDTHLADVTLDDAQLGIDESDMTLLGGTFPLAPSASATYYVETTTTSDLDNTVAVGGNPVEAGGDDIPAVADVSATATASFTESAAGIDLVKSVYAGHDAGASCATGVETQYAGGGQAVTWCFVVTNLSEAPTHLADVQITDPDLDLADLALAAGSDPFPLAPGASATYYVESTASDDLVNEASVTANPVDAGGTDLPGVADPSDQDTAEVVVVAPGISVAKTVLWGSDGTACPGVESVFAVAGDDVTYCFVVTNTGDVDLDDVGVDDTDLGVDETSMTLQAGDAAVPLAPGESLTWSHTTTSSGDLTNTASATATPVDPDGSPVPGATPPTADDTASLDQVAPSVTVDKTVHAGHDSGSSCPGAPSLASAMAAAVTYCFTVTNTGDTYLDDVTLDDPDLGVDETDMTLLSGTFPLAPSGGTAVFFVETTFDTVNDADTFVNTVDVAANPTDDGGTDLPNVDPVTDQGTATLDATAPAFTVAKTVSLGHDAGASCAGVESVRGGEGADVTYCFTVTNTGGTYLDAVSLDDTTLGVDESDMTVLSGTEPVAPGGTLSFFYETTVPADDLTNTVSADATPSDAAGTPTGDDPAAVTDTASVDVPEPAMTVSKTLYIGHDDGASCAGAASLTGPTGLEVTYCFVVTNTGDTHLAALTLDDAQLGIDETGMTLLSGTFPLAPSATATFYVETATSASLDNTVTAGANPVESNGDDIPAVDDVSATDTASYTESVVGIGIAKTVHAGHDDGVSCAGVETQYVGAGQAVTWCFVVTNLSDAPTHLADIEITDPDLDLTGLATAAGSDPLPLAPGATVTYYVELTATDDLENTASVSANPVDSGGADLPGVADPTDDDTAEVVVVEPGIEVAKTVFWGAYDEGAAATSCPGAESVVALAGDAVTYCFVVTNTGDVDLDAIEVSDGDLSIDQDDMVLRSGTLPLVPDASLVYSHTTTSDGDLTNTASATATPVDPDGATVPGATSPTDDDTAALDEVAPSMTVDKTVHAGHDTPDGDRCPGGVDLTIQDGRAVTYCFVVTNTGDTDLDDVTVIDPDLGIDRGDMTLVSGTEPVAPAGTLVFAYETTVDGDLENTVEVSAQPTDGDTPLPNIERVDDGDTVTVDAVNPSLAVAKSVYVGHDDGVSCDGGELVAYPAGSPITYCFTVANTGDTHVTDVTVDDADLGIDVDDLTVVTGDPTAPLPPAGTITWAYETSVTGPLTNTATVDGTPSDAAGDEIVDADIEPTTDTAEVRETAVGLAIDKTIVAGHDDGASCPGGPGLTVAPGTAVTYCFTITNTSEAPTYLDEVLVDDPALGLTAASLPIASGATPIAPGASIVVHAEATATDDLVNTASATATPTDETGEPLPGVEPPTSEDEATLTVLEPRIELEKSVSPDTVTAGIESEFTFVASNTGEVPLGDVTLTDDQCSPISGPTVVEGDGDGLLEPGEQWGWTCTRTIQETVTNIATVDAVGLCPGGLAMAGTGAASAASCPPGEPLPGGAVQASDDATVTVLSIDLMAAKEILGEVEPGGTATFLITVTNLGADPAPDVVMEDPLQDGLTLTDASGGGWDCGTSTARTVRCTRPVLGAGASATVTIVTAVADDLSGELTNTVSVFSQIVESPPLLINNQATASVVLGSPIPETGAPSSGLLVWAIAAIMLGWMFVWAGRPRVHRERRRT